MEEQARPQWSGLSQLHEPVFDIPVRLSQLPDVAAHQEGVHGRCSGNVCKLSTGAARGDALPQLRSETLSGTPQEGSREGTDWLHTRGEGPGGEPAGADGSYVQVCPSVLWAKGKDKKTKQPARRPSRPRRFPRSLRPAS